jgi:hypothetical protein
MSGSADRRSSIEQRLMEEPRRAEGVDGSGEPVRLGERDSGGHIVGYIDEQGLAWESLRERILAVSGARLAEALALPYDDARGDEVLEAVPGCSSRSPEKQPDNSGSLSLGVNSAAASANRGPSVSAGRAGSFFAANSAECGRIARTAASQRD